MGGEILCSVSTCKNSYKRAKLDGQLIRFFRYPKNPLMCKTWIRKCKQHSNFDPKNRRVCSSHFKVNDYEDEIQAQIMNYYPPMKLKKNAVPSLNLPSSVLQPESSSTHSSTSGRTKRSSKGKKYLKQHSSNPKDCVTVPIQRKDKISDKDMKEIAIPIEESNKISETNMEKEVNVSSQEESKISDQNTRLVVVTVPIVQTVVQSPHEDCACGVSQNCHKSQLLSLQEENKILKQNEGVLKQVNEAAQKRIHELEFKFETKVKTAFKHFLSPNQVDAVLKKKKKIRWTEEEYLKAFNVLQLNKRFYLYLKDTLNYPLPGLSTLQNWITHMSLRIESDCSAKYNLSDRTINSESLPFSDHLHSVNLPLDQSIDSENLPSNNSIKLQNLPSSAPIYCKNQPLINHAHSEKLTFDQPTHSEDFPTEQTVGSDTLKPKELCNIVGDKQIKKLHIHSDHHKDSENLFKKKASTVVNKSFQFHLSHKNYFNKLILNRLRRKVFKPTKPKHFVCSKCQKGFDLSSALKRHFKRHVLENPWTCDVCEEVFSSKFYLDRHITTHRNGDRFVCDICDQSFIQKVNFHVHYLKHKNMEPQNVCNEELNTGQCINETSTSDEHCSKDEIIQTNQFVQVKVKPYLCHICNEMFASKSDLRSHLPNCKIEKKSASVKNVYGDKAIYICEWCNRGFRYHQYFQNHILKHKNRKMFVCDICSKAFAKPQRLQQHLILHNNEKNNVQYFCNVCHKGFRQKRYLTQHLKTHSDKKPYACDLCPKRFTQYSTLKKHIESHKTKLY